MVTNTTKTIDSYASTSELQSLSFSSNNRIAFSNNSRLENIFTSSPKWVNREFTVPARVKSEAVFTDETVTDDFQKKYIDPAMRVIITPHAYEKLNSTRRTQVKVLASPYECGRVLEADQEVLINNTPHVLTIKGVGCTTFARTTGAENPWMSDRHRDFNVQDHDRLTKMAFWNYYGVLNKTHAEEQIKGAKNVAALGVDCEKILLLKELTHLPDSAGRQQKIEFLINKGLIAQEVEPCLMVRAIKSNLRLLEPIMLNELKEYESIAPFFEHAINLWGRHNNILNPTANQYYQWLFAKVFEQELNLIMRGFQMSSGFWQDLGRNISILGEELDLEDMKVSSYLFDNYYQYLDHVERNMMNTENVLLRYGDLLNSYGNEEINFKAIEHAIIPLIKKEITEEKMTLLLDGFNTQERYYKPKNLRELSYMLVDRISTLYSGYTIGGLESQAAIVHHATLKKLFKDLLGKR